MGKRNSSAYPTAPCIQTILATQIATLAYEIDKRIIEANASLEEQVEPSGMGNVHERTARN